MEKALQDKTLLFINKGEQIFTEKKQEIIKGYQEGIIYISFMWS